MTDEVRPSLSIYHLIDGRFPCGVSTVTKDLVHALQQNNVDVQMLSLYPGSVAESAKEMGLNVRVVQGQSMFDRWRDLVRILRESHAQGRAPIVHSHQLRANRFASLAALWTRVPHVISIHTHKEVFIRNQFPNPVKRQIIRFIHYWTLNRAAARVAVSCGVLRELNERGHVGTRTQFVRNITPLPDGNENSSTDYETMRASLGIPEGTFTVLAAGRLVTIKRFDLLIQAILQLKAELGDVVILLVGDGPLKEELEQAAETEGVSDHIRFLGWQSSLTPYMVACDCIVSCSQTETVGMVLVEGMSLKRPVVAAAVEDVAALIEDQRTGLLFPVDDGEAMCKTIVQVARDPDLARQLGQAAHEEVYRLFDAKVTIRQILEIYQSL